MDGKDFYIVPVFGGLGKPSAVPMSRVYKGGYVSYKDAYANGGDVVTYIKRTIVPVEQHQQASWRR